MLVLSSLSFQLTLSAPALQTYVIQHTHMTQKFHFSKVLFLPWLTIVLHRKTKESNTSQIWVTDPLVSI